LLIEQDTFGLNAAERAKKPLAVAEIDDGKKLSRINIAVPARAASAFVRRCHRTQPSVVAWRSAIVMLFLLPPRTFTGRDAELPQSAPGCMKAMGRMRHAFFP
jgi:hypothetical protein